MSISAIVLLSIGLAMDATAVSAAKGVSVPHLKTKDVAFMATCFGGMQALMPWLGTVIGSSAGPYIAQWDHWIAFTLLGFLGGKMLYEAFYSDDNDSEDSKQTDPFAVQTILLLGIATSIDALAAGFTLPTLGVPVGPTIATIGVLTALLSVGGVFLGRRFGAMIGKRLDVLGGVILIALGVKVLIEHKAFGELL